MKHTSLKQCLLLLFVAADIVSASAQKNNNRGDNIIGNYQVDYESQSSRVRFFKASDGTYTAQVTYLRDSVNPSTGQLVLDRKNPDKKLRNIPCNRIVIVRGLQYNTNKKHWDKGRIYDPTRGIRASCTASFTPDGKSLQIRGSVMGIGETILWKVL